MIRQVRLARKGVFAQAEERYLFWENVGTFLSRKECEMNVDPAPQESEELLRLFILETGFGVSHHQRGLLVMHAALL